MKIKLTNLIIAAIIFCLPVFAQDSKRPLGWDLSYLSVLRANRVGSNEWIRKWLALDDQSVAKKWISEWRGDPIISSILIEYPAFHAAEHTTEWLIRTENDAYYWRIVNDTNEPKLEKKYLTLQAFDDLFREVSVWQQATRRHAKDLPPGTSTDEINFLTGYIGFLSTYEKSKSRQLLLTMEDFVICNGKKCTPESRELKPGRVLSALTNLPRDPRCWEKEYKIKSTVEIAVMTPRQLIDELIKSPFGRYNSLNEMADYENSIEKKIRQSAREILPILTEYLNAYEPQNFSECDESRFAVAQKIAFDIDELTLRLRGTKEGQHTLAAFERAVSRIEKSKDKEKTNRYAYSDLNRLNGINLFDEAIRDTFWVNKKIKISDSELLEFSNFLISREPMYPSWSNKHLIKDYSRVNEAGIPAQVYVLTNPTRFYDAFAEFKKSQPGNH